MRERVIFNYTGVHIGYERMVFMGVGYADEGWTNFKIYIYTQMVLLG